MGNAEIRRLRCGSGSRAACHIGQAAGRGGAYGATVTSVNDRFYRLIVDSGNIQARVALTSSDELLTRGDRVTLLVYGYDEKRNYVWGACHKV